MIHRPTNRRGASLVEVLIALGLIGIGLTSVITLFPFSALTLGQALRDDRTTTCAIMADGQLREIHLRNVVEPGDARTTEPYHWAMDNGDGTQPLARTDSGPSYPVFVDPMGSVAGRGNIGDNRQPTDSPTRVPRVNLDFINRANALDRPPLARRYCSLMDSMTFDEDGNVPGGFDMRELRYNFAWVLQRPVNRDRYTVRMHVIVYNQRAHLYTPPPPGPGSEAVHNGVMFTPGDTTITGVPLNADVHKGTWVMDATTNYGTATEPADGDGQRRPKRHAEFYRVLSVTDVGGSYTLEVHKPISRPDGLSNPANTSVYAYSGTLVVLPGVADVFERPNLTAGMGP